MPEFDESSIRARLAAMRQDHLLAGLDRLGVPDREALLTDLTSLDLAYLGELIDGHVLGGDEAPSPGDLEPAEAFASPDCDPWGGAYAEARALGESLISEGRVAAMVVAGGQGTRLGFDGPKGAFQISPVRHKPLFQLFAESIRGTARRFGGRIVWYVMTSPTNDRETKAFIEKNDFFGMKRADVRFFSQGTVPSFSMDGKILMESPTRVTRSPDGHGGSLTALTRSGCLKEMAELGVEVLSYFQVDNPLVRPVDPLFVGLHAKTESEASSLTVRKADDLERVGHFAKSGGKTVMVEYSDMPEELARARNADGSRRFDLANIAVHLFSRAYLERVTGTGGTLSLPWHRAVKKVAYYDPVADRRVHPDGPNAVKLERFVFDVLPLAERTMILERDRTEVFSPVKNADGVDSVTTAGRDMNRRAARWLKAAGFDLPVDGAYEISPLVANDASELAESGIDVTEIGDGAAFYVG